MTPNVGPGDRAIRILVGVALGFTAWVDWPLSGSFLSPTGMVSLAYLIAGVEVLATVIFGWSPVYALVGFSTKATTGA